MNEVTEPNAEKVAEMLGLELAHEEVEVDDWYLEGGEGWNETIATAIENAQKAAMRKLEWHEHAPHTRNDRYHNAALSLAFAIKTQTFQVVSTGGTMDPKVKRALVDFLSLMDWASPQSWKLRTEYVKDIQMKLAEDKVKDRRDMESLIDGDMDSHRATGSNELWGYIDHDEEGWSNKLFRTSQGELAKNDKLWTKACTHSEPAKGFTCGLW